MAAWEGCTRCPLHLTARTHVLADLSEGLRPHVLFIGEGPGKSENVLGKPFVGKSGRLLRRAVSAVRPPGVQVAYANLVACRPCSDAHGPNRAPFHPEILACAPRLSNLVELLNPRKVCLLGKVPEAYGHLIPLPEERTLHALAHPAWIVRRGGECAKEWPDYLEKLRALMQP